MLLYLDQAKLGPVVHFQVQFGKELTKWAIQLVDHAVAQVREGIRMELEGLDCTRFLSRRRHADPAVRDYY